MKDVFDLPDGIEYLRTSGKKVLLYGMGNGAEKAHALLNSQGIEVSGVFASDGFVRGHSFMGYPVLSMSAAEEIYGDYIAVLSFGLEGRKELTQKEVACKLGISQSYISRLEKRIMLRLRKEIMRQTSCV